MEVDAERLDKKSRREEAKNKYWRKEKSLSSAYMKHIP